MPATLKPSPAPVPKRSLAEPPPRPKPPLPRRVLNFLSGFACACILLVMLGLLTWLATLEMKDAGLHATLRKYFDSGPQAVFVVPRLFGENLPIVLLGGYWTCVLLFVNLALGGILRMRKGPKQAGVLIVHASILMLLVAGAVSHHFEERGNMLIPEGGSSNVAEDYHEPTVEIVEIIDGQPAAVHVIRGRHFTDLEPGSKLPFRTIRLPNLPFDLDLGGYLSNADIEIAALKPAGPDRLVFDGYYPVEKPDELHAEQNTPATIGRVVRRDGKRGEPFLLHARAFHPFTVRDGDRVFTVSLRKRQWVMPFIVTLDKFTAEFYPGTNKPAAFASDITRTGDGPAVKARIEMNEPMRIHGLTFYQASYSQMGRGPEARMASVFEVVSNPADQWPRYSTFVLAFGLLVHFSIRLAPAFRALFRRGHGSGRKPEQEEGPPPAPAAAKVRQTDKLPRGRLVAAALALVALAGIALTALYQSTPRGGPRQIAGYERWQPEIVALAAKLPVQDGGRIKPLSARASFTLYALHGSRSLRVKDAMGKSHSLSPTEWMLDTLFRPELAVHQPVFRVDNSAVLAAIGLPTQHKRDRYSFVDIGPGLEKLSELAAAYDEIPADQREPLQNQILDFYHNVAAYHTLLRYFDFARDGIVISRDGAIPRLAVSQAMAMAPQTLAELKAARTDGRDPDPGALTFYNLVFDTARGASRGPRLFPPAAADTKDWNSCGDSIIGILNGEVDASAPNIADIRRLEEACAALASGQEAFRTKFATLHDDLTRRAEARSEGRWVALEASYHRMDWFFKALLLFSLGIVTSLAMWLAGGRAAGKPLAWATFGLTLAGFLICSFAIAQRIIIMGRSPIGNLYDTIIFIAAVATGLALLVELFFRRRLALGVAPVLGAALVLLSRRFEIGDAKDHLDPLVAVLASNFWLTVHVITIVIGYAGGLLAAFFSTIYILMRGLRLDGRDPELRRGLTVATYAMVCFCLFFSLLGTILGGIWANDSWGRFWGWDPKENGALLIVLWTLVILHARLGGFIREWGVHFATAFLACVVAFSWWHVNFLNVGLHNYGFTAGQSTVWTFYGGMAAIIVFGIIAKIIESADAPTLATGEKA